MQYTKEKLLFKTAYGIGCDSVWVVNTSNLSNRSGAGNGADASDHTGRIPPTTPLSCSHEIFLKFFIVIIMF